MTMFDAQADRDVPIVADLNPQQQWLMMSTWQRACTDCRRWCLPAGV